MQHIALLILFQSFWSCSYVAMKVGLGQMPLGLVIIIRYATAFTFLMGWILIASHAQKRRTRLSAQSSENDSTQKTFKLTPLSEFGRRDLCLVLLIGLLTFSASPYFQLSSLRFTYATDLAFLVTFEPIITTMLAMFILRERVRTFTMFIFAVATVGALIMSGSDAESGAAMAATRLLGNGIFVVAMICEGLFSITSRSVTQRHHPLQVITLMTGTALLGNLLIHHQTLTLQNLSVIGWQGWFSTVFILGIGCSVIGYGGWTYLSKHLPVSQLTLSLFLQPIIGGAVAFLILGEVPTLRMILGASVVFSSLLVWTWWQMRLRAHSIHTISTPITPDGAPIPPQVRRRSSKRPNEAHTESSRAAA